MTTSIPKRRGRPPSGGREAIVAATLQLLREQGVARFTTREVAARAQVSEASIFYHYGDRAGLLQAVFAEGLRPLEALNNRGFDTVEPGDVLDTVARAIEHFLDQTLPVIMAAQADVELRDALAAYMTEHDLGPHRGVRAVADFLATEQRAGRVGEDVDVEAAALMLVSTCFLRSSQRLITPHGDVLPSLDRAVAEFTAMIRRP
ncbi:MAG TPA: TetR/AcrR family transcriptional regulator [Micromonosporaceae bacterium]